MSKISYGIFVTLTCLMMGRSTEARPVTEVQAVFFVNTASQCIAGNNFLFTNNSAGPGTLKYSWDFGDGTTSTAVNPGKVYERAGTFNVKLTVRGQGGTNTRTLSVTVHEMPLTGFTVNDDAQDLEKNAFQFLTSALEEGYTYTWKFGDGTTCQDRDPVKRYRSPGTYEVEQVVTDAHGCEDSATIRVQVTGSEKQMLSLRGGLEVPAKKLP
jgi:PKD repeat protein